MNKKIIGILCAGLVLLPGCVQVPSYQGKSLKIFSDSCTYRKTENGITLRAKRLNTPEKNYLLSNRTIRLSAHEPVEMIYFSIHNLSCYPYAISPEFINIPQLSYRQTAQSIKTSSLGAIAKGVGSGVGVSVVVNSLAIGGSVLLAAQIGTPIVVPYALLFGLPVVAIVWALPFLGKSFKSMIMNRRIGKDLKVKLLRKKVIIKPGARYQGLICVKKSDYNDQFSLAVEGKKDKNNKIVFDVDLFL